MFHPTMSWLLRDNELVATRRRVLALALSGTDWFVRAADYIEMFTCLFSLAVSTRRPIMQTLNASPVQV